MASEPPLRVDPRGKDSPPNLPQVTPPAEAGTLCIDLPDTQAGMPSDNASLPGLQPNREAEFKRLLDIYERTNRVARVGAWEMDLRTQILWWSEVTREIHEQPPGFCPHLQDALNYYVEGYSRETITQHFHDAVRLGKSFDLELQIRTAKGKLRWVRAVGQACYENGQPVAVNGAFQDITERHLARERLLEANRRLQENATFSAELAQEAQTASRAKGDFLASMSHEIRTPLNAIIGAIELLGESNLNHHQQELAHLALSSSNLLLSTLNSVLDFSRIESGKVDVDPVVFDLAAELDLILDGMRASAETKGLQLLLQRNGNLPRRVRGDKSLLRQILVNLLGNAVKFTDKGQVELEIQCNNLPKVDFFVRDTGPGIPPEKLKSIFRPFEQADRSRARQHVGTGLGLTISQRLCASLGGHITVESQPGVGSVFHVQVPLPPDQEAETSTDQRRAPENVRQLLSTARILLVEDNNINTVIGKLLLQSMGCQQIFYADNGEKALLLLEENECDVVLMDCFMPVMDGLETTRELRRREASQPGRRRTPVIGLSASTERDCIEAALQAGMDAYLTKPVKRTKLAAAILQHTGLHSSGHPAGS
jgi:signal transduction histidine kinase/ActR/RegA family two-component response regulator